MLRRLWRAPNAWHAIGHNPPAEVAHVGDLDISVQVSEKRTSIRLAAERGATLTAMIPADVDEAVLVNLRVPSG